LSFVSEKGLYTRSGTRLDFEIRYPFGEVRFSGEGRGDVVIVFFSDENSLVFSDPRGGPGPVSGTLEIVAVAQDPLPPTEDTQPSCRFLVEDGSLVLEPDSSLDPWTGRYTLNSAVTAACGQVSAPRLIVEAGTYEQVAHSLDFQSLEGGVLWHTSGEVREDEVRMIRGGENDLVFRLRSTHGP
jgi:hypothetical protein